MALDFPINPVLGETFDKWIWDGEKWVSYSTTGLEPERWEVVQTFDLAGLNRVDFSPPDPATTAYRITYWGHVDIEGGLFISHQIGGVAQSWNRSYRYLDRHGNGTYGTGNVTGGLAGWVNQFGEVRGSSEVLLVKDPGSDRWTYRSNGFAIENYANGTMRSWDSSGYTEPPPEEEADLTQFSLFLQGATWVSGTIVVEGLLPATSGGGSGSTSTNAPEVLVARKTDASTTITGTSTGAPTYVTGTYVLVPAVDYARVAVVSATVSSGLPSGGTVAGRVASYFIGRQIDLAGGFGVEQYPYGFHTVTGLENSGSASVNFSVVVDIPAGQTNEFRIYGYKNSSALGATAGTAHTQTLVELFPVTSGGGGTTVVPEPWTDVTFQNGWSNQGTYQKAQYRKVGDMVQLRGRIAGGTAGVAAFTLPSDMWPPEGLSVPAIYASNAPLTALVNVTPTGEFQVYSDDLRIIGYAFEFSVTA